MSNRDRDLEIARRRLAGEAPRGLAREFDISPERIWQIVQAEQRRQRGEPPKSRRRNTDPVQAPVHPAIRPRLRLWPGRPSGTEWWECAGDMRIGVGATKPEAFAQWLGKKSSTAAEEPAASTTTPEPEPMAPALTPVHASQVHVLPGVAGRKPLRMAATLGLNAERIGAQPRMHSMHGGSRARTGGFHDQD